MHSWNDPHEKTKTFVSLTIKIQSINLSVNLSLSLFPSLVLLLSTENKVIVKNFAIFLYLAFKRRELLLREWSRDCIVTFVHFVFVYVHIHTVKNLDIRVIAISYDLHVPLNTLLKYSWQLLV